MDFCLRKKDIIGIHIPENEDEAVKIAAGNLFTDLYKTMEVEVADASPMKISIETVSELSSHPETYELSVKEGILYIKGSDRRGTVYGIYTLSAMLGVSPWYYFADVPPKKRETFILREGLVERDYPTVEYRGIFINDEEELDKWARLHMNEPTIGYNTYEKIFELLLRVKANYIWPAMHVNSFNMQPESGALATKMGLVVGTSHCDMLMRSNFREWEPWIKKKGYEGAEYDYSIEGKNREILKEYWRESVEQNRDFEVCYTLGMRGIHDSGFITSALTAENAEELKDKKVKLLEQVINDQKQILDETLGRKTLMTFVPYKEVLNLYDRGLRVPEDITLIWTNDNYGYVRRYPSEKERLRAGGNGIYYHNSYWAPSLRHYLFMSSQPLAQTKYEMEKAYENGIRKLWVVNMGAIKPLETELQFFMDLAWDIDKETRKTADTEQYLEQWINANFSGDIGGQTAPLLNRFARVNMTRKVEHLEEDVFAQDTYVNEGAIRLNTLREISLKLTEIYESLPNEEKEAFFQLVLMRVHGAYFSNAMYYFADRSVICSKSGRETASREYTRLSKGFEDMRRRMLHYYNEEMCGGKWKGIVTPEDFPPPRTAMHPASRPALHITDKDREDVNSVSGNRAFSLIATAGKTENCRIINNLGRGTRDLLELSERGIAEYEFCIGEDTEAEIELHRYPSLNSVGEIYVYAGLDSEEPVKISTESNDEWRGTWAENIMNQVDKITLFKGRLSKGKHKLTLAKASKYFAFSKLVVYEGEKLYDNLGIIAPNVGDYASQELPNGDYLKEATGLWYGLYDVGEKTIPLGRFVDHIEPMALTDSTDYTGRDKELFMPDRELSYDELCSFGSFMPVEKDEAIIIEGMSAYNGGSYASCEGGWDYSTGVSYRRTNMALYFRGRRDSFSEENAPRLKYRFKAEGGEYVIYVLMRYCENKASRVHLSLDNEPVESAWRNERPWRYEGEQPFRYVPLAKMNIPAGEHELALEIFSSNLRIERIIIKGSHE